jgi:radical SAM superfamily enzyme YgiQ (UPF0313 family)
MKVVVINCPVRCAAPPTNIPLGIYCVGASIKRSFPDDTVVYVDLNLHRPELLASQAADLLPEADLYLLSGLITTYRWQKTLCKLIRTKFPGKPIVSGGGLASNIGGELIGWIGCDGIAIGEGEDIAPAIRAHAAAGHVRRVYKSDPPVIDRLPEFPWDDVQGIETYIGNPIWGGAAKNSSATPFEMKRSINIVASRGCPHACRFCSRQMLGGRKYRAKPGKDLAKDVLALVDKYNLDFVGLTDDNFVAHPRNAVEFAKAIGGRVRWGCHSRFDEMDDPELIGQFAAGGCVYVGFGGESANVEILAAMNKKNDPEQMVRVLGMCRLAGIHPNATWMWGWPGETREQVRETAQFMLRYAPENKSLFAATAYPGTSLWDEVEMLVLDQFGSVENYVAQLGDATKVVINLSGMSGEEFAEVRGHIERGELEQV